MKILRRNRRTVSSYAHQLMRSYPSASDLLRRAFRSVHHMASNLSFSAGVSVALSS